MITDFPDCFSHFASVYVTYYTLTMPKRKRGSGWRKKKRLRTSKSDAADLAVNKANDESPSMLTAEDNDQASTSGYNWTGGLADPYESSILRPPPTKQHGCGCHKETDERFIKGRSRRRMCHCSERMETNSTDDDKTDDPIQPNGTADQDALPHTYTEKERDTFPLQQIPAATNTGDVLSLSQEIQQLNIDTQRVIPEVEHEEREEDSAVLVDSFYAGSMNQVCPHCAALRFKAELRPYNCCHSGKVCLPQLLPIPDEIKNLFTGQDEKSKNFQQNIRRYNSAMAFASMGASVAPPPGHGPYVYRIHGQTYHKSGCLHPDPGKPPRYGQLYILEGQQATAARIANDSNEGCRADVLQTLHDTLEYSSPYAAAFKHMLQVEQENPHKEVKMWMMKVNDQQRHNLPRHDEVAAVFVGEDGAPTNPDFAVYPKGKALQKIPYTSPNLDPMVYPLLFPRGDPGWSETLQHAVQHRTAKHTRVTMLQFYSYRLAVRAGFSTIHAAQKLFQQFLVDAYVRHEANRLYFCRMNQGRLRVDMYKGLTDYVHTKAAESGLRPGKVVVLPSSFIGSPRAMQQHYQDAMAIVTKYGKPDFFLTYTCNPKAREITENLQGGRPEFRPDLVARVYKLHLDSLLHDIATRHVLGVPVCHIHVIEFQKRGLPHCHLLITLRECDKLREIEDIDAFISAELPDPAIDPELHRIIKCNMIHGPCGVINPKSVCMSDGKCTKNYPKEYADKTELCDNGYPRYRRRNNGRKVTVGGREVDNRWVVPYNPWLSKKYGAHINLEACTSIKTVKYLFKYVYKGHDCARIRMHGDAATYEHDEISTFLEARYVSAPEAFWRLSEFPMHKQSHSVIRLPVHLHLEQNVYFKPGEEDAAVSETADHNTMLTAWFKLNSESEESRNLLYTEMPEHYVFQTAKKAWMPRKKGANRIIPRMYAVSVRDAERFFLRVLLLHVRGATSYESLRTYRGRLYDTNREACLARGLLEDDSEWNNALNEAEVFQMPVQLRGLFATILLYCNPSEPLQLWNAHQEAFREDFARTNSVPNAIYLAWKHVDSILMQQGKSCHYYGILEPEHDEMAQQSPDSFNPEEEAQQAAANRRILNAGQARIVDEITTRLNNRQSGIPNQGGAFYIDGPGGSGKTMVYNTLISFCRGHYMNVASAAWTGIAATLLAGGRTIHSLFKLPVPLLDTSVCNIVPTSRHAAFLRSLDLILLDEASMVPTHALHAIERTLRDVCDSESPFGGKIFVLGGDFRQVLPVVPRASRAAILDTCLKRSSLWSSFKQFRLTENMRAADEQAFSAWLLEVGNGSLPSASDHNAEPLIEIPESCVCKENIIDAVYDDMLGSDIDQRVILCPRNDDTLEVNQQVLDRLPGCEKAYFSVDDVQCDDREEQENYPLEFLNSLTPSGLPQHCLRLKEGAIVMLLRNLDQKAGLCNGTRLRIVALYNNVVDAENLSATRRVFIPRISLTTADSTLPFILRRRQFPLRLAYSMTINKSQGQTFGKVGLLLKKPVFAHGQLYVALSRVRSLSSLSVHVVHGANQGQLGRNVVTRNVVYLEALK